MSENLLKIVMNANIVQNIGMGKTEYKNKGMWISQYDN